MAWSTASPISLSRSSVNSATEVACGTDDDDDEAEEEDSEDDDHAEAEEDAAAEDDDTDGLMSVSCWNFSRRTCLYMELYVVLVEGLSSSPSSTQSNILF